MTRALPDLLESLEWNIAARRTLIGTRQGDRWVIPPQTVGIESFACLIGIQSPNALAHWYLGAWATQIINVSPSSTSNFVPYVDASRRTIRLRVLNLMVVPKLLSPWILELKFPYWLDQIYMEVWRYDGRDIDELQRLDELQALIQQP